MSERTWSIQEVVQASGTTSRTLRHYQRIGLLEPCRSGSGGQRFYDADGLLRLQRILLLRGLGLGLREIGRVLDERIRIEDALEGHARELERERDRLDAVAASVRDTISMIEEGGELVAEKMFEGFDHTRYREEVEQRWGSEAYANADAWWRSLGEDERQRHRNALDSLVAGFADAAKRGLDVHGEEAQALAAGQYEWVRAGWGGTPPNAEAFTGLGEMYVADPRFGAVYSAEGVSFAEYVRDAMAVYAERHLA